jgi:hypothetical protein
VPIRSKLRVKNSAGISVYKIGTIALFVILKDRGFKNVILKDCLYIPGLMKSLFSWSKLKSLNQHYYENHRDMFIYKILNNELIPKAMKSPCTHLFNIPTKTLEIYMTYTFLYKALRHPSHDLMKYIDMFSDRDLILSKPKDFECDSCL